MGSTNCWRNRKQMGVIENKYNYQVFQKASKTVAVKVSNNTVVEIDSSLKQIFSQMGICIPPAQQQIYDGKRVVYLEDPKFAQAFHDVYFHLCMNKTEYELLEMPNRNL